MSFQKAADLLRLAEMAAARYQGVSLTEIEETFAIDRRTAQRMTRALEDMFPGCTTRVDDGRRKFWKLRAEDARLMLAQGIRDVSLRWGPSFCAEDFRLGPTLCPTIDTDPKSRSYL